MLHEEQVRVIVFIGGVFSVYATAAWLAFRAIVQRSAKRRASLGEGCARRVVLGLATFGLCCGVYGRFVEPFWLDVSHIQVALPRWRGDTLRIVHLSDIHSVPVARLEDRVPEHVRAQRPELIVFTGDAINAPEGLDNFKRCLTKLARAKSPTAASCSRCAASLSG